MKDIRFIIKIVSFVTFLITVVMSCNNKESNNYKGNVEAYITTADESMLFKKVLIEFDTDNKSSLNTIKFDTSTKYQTMEGFGMAITGSSCYNLLKMSPENRHKLLVETFDPKEHMGYSYIRISIGCSDFSMDDYTCCDKEGIENFEINEYDKRDLIPILKEIKNINPDVKILATPWTCPRWMKVNNLNDLKPHNEWTDGQLNPSYYSDYATYFVKFIKAMQSYGLDIDAITPQNEPLNRGNSASLYMTWQEQRDFIKTALGPQFEANNISTKIICYDHNYNYDVDKAENADQQGYPNQIYNDPEASKYISASAFHAYGGDKSELNNVHNLNPEKGIWFTEQSLGTWMNYTFANDFMETMREICLGTINNNCQLVILWNFMLDEKHEPYRPGGCDVCMGAIDISSRDYVTMKKNSYYYNIAHLSKVILPGARRVKTYGYSIKNLYYSGFENPDGTKSVVLQNDGVSSMKISVYDGSKTFSYNVPAKSVISCKW